MAGVEPTPHAPKARTLPLRYTRMVVQVFSLSDYSWTGRFFIGLTSRNHDRQLTSDYVATPTRLELAISNVTGWRIHQLSHGAVLVGVIGLEPTTF